MFDTLKSLWSAFSGKLRETRQARKLVWLLLVVFLFGWVCVVYAAWGSFPSYHAMIAFQPFAEGLALTFTVGIASFLYFSLAYIAGFLVEKWKKVSVCVGGGSVCAQLESFQRPERIVVFTSLHIDTVIR